ncbi:polyol transporter 5-like [Rutidosis leptorrhynchoides]|uniref:polyol transporter 5-like n=1 Tax=Rutidosis leptorrhynchoides TaxID=125765 RepID=UPI003A99C35C
MASSHDSTSSHRSSKSVPSSPRRRSSSSMASSSSSRRQRSVDFTERHSVESEHHLLGSIQERSTDVVINTLPRESIENPPLILTNYAISCAMGASIASLLFGLVIGVMSEAPAYIKKDRRITEEHVDFQAGIINSFSVLGAAMAGGIADWIGRRSSIKLTSTFFFVGMLLMGLGPNNALLLGGRAISQVGIGLALTIAPVYIAEISPAIFRGLLTSFPEVFINLGTLLGIACNYTIPMLVLNHRWLLMFGLGTLSSVLLTIGIRVMPESPRWLAMQGRRNDAKQVLTRTYNSDVEADRQLAEIMEALDKFEGSMRRELHNPTLVTWHMKLCAVGINVIQQACGVETMLLYSPRIYEKAGLTSTNWKMFLPIIVHMAKTLPILIPIFRLDMDGRRNLMLISLGGMSLSLGVLGTCLVSIDRNGFLSWLAIASIASFVFYVAFYAIGVGPITSIYSSEVFTLRLRAHGHATAVAVNRGMNVIFTIMFIPLYKAITLGKVAFIFMTMSILGGVAVYHVMPETKGKTLEELWWSFGKILPWMSNATGTTEARTRTETETGRSIEMAQAQGG